MSSKLAVDLGKVWGASAGMTFESAKNDEPDPDFGTKDIFRTPSWYGFVETWGEPVTGASIADAGGLDGADEGSAPMLGYIAEDRLEESGGLRRLECECIVSNRHWRRSILGAGGGHEEHPERLSG